MDAMEHGALPDGEKVSQQISDIVNSESFKKALAAQKTLIDEPGAAAVKAFEKAAEEAAEEAGSGIEDLAKELLEHS
jgi:hypothetical protein